MKLTKTGQALYEEISVLNIIDAHEHLPSEAEYLSHNYSGLNMFTDYILGDLASAGLPHKVINATWNDTIPPVEKWWKQIKPFWENIKHSSYSKALRITANDLYGIKEFNDKSIITFAEKIKSDNKPGIYKKILCDLCHIKYSITCYNDNSPIAKDFMLKTIIRGEPRIQDLLTSKNPPKDINEFIDIVKVILRKNLKNGGIGFKMFVGEYGEDNLKLAESELKDFLKQKGTLFYEDRRQYSHLLCCYHNALFDVAAEANVPIAVHAGYWGDFRQLDPKMMFSFALRRQDVKFDLFHLGMPMVRDAAIIGKTLPNVTLNLVWCPIISQAQTASILNEIIDMVPLNKIIAFGGDYRVCIQKVYGHLKMAKEVVAGVLASRIETGDFDMKEALRIAGMWFYENPARIYKLK